MPSFPVRITAPPRDTVEAARFLLELGIAFERVMSSDNQIVVFHDARTALAFVNLIAKLGGQAYLFKDGSLAARPGVVRPTARQAPPRLGPADGPQLPAKPGPKPAAPPVKLSPSAKAILGDDDPFG